MKIFLDRLRPTVESLPGLLYVGSDGDDQDFFCYTLEPRADRAEHPAIPAGTYRVTVEPTHNSKLWTPYPDRHLPRVHDVPGRTGIVLHAGNTAADTEGCVVLGFDRRADGVFRSRDAVKALVDRLLQGGGPYEITVLDPKPA
jgi:hypothetical protein